MGGVSNSVVVVMYRNSSETHIHAQGQDAYESVDPARSLARGPVAGAGVARTASEGDRGNEPALYPSDPAAACGMGCEVQRQPGRRGLRHRRSKGSAPAGEEEDEGRGLGWSRVGWFGLATGAGREVGSTSRRTKVIVRREGPAILTPTL